MSRAKILCVTDHFLPGYKAGGPIRTIVNLCKTLSGEIVFDIVTRDHDLGDNTSFVGVTSDEWRILDGVRVYYASPENFGVPAIERAWDGHDVLYLNSFFSARGSIFPYWKFRRRMNILIAPRGEFSEGALSIKGLKKRIYLGLVKLLGLYRDIHWHASTDMEAADIERVFPGSKVKTHLAADPVLFEEPEPHFVLPADTAADLSVAFISRISPKKNLDGLLSILATVRRSITLAIYGPVGDDAYWARCQASISALPHNITVEYRGTLLPDEVSAAFARHDLFVFPTLGENFGHVIFESLRVGTPVMLSDQTPWEDDGSGAVTVARLDTPEVWRDQIEAAADRLPAQRAGIRAATLDYARCYALNGKVRLDNFEMFARVAADKRPVQAGG